MRFLGRKLPQNDMKKQHVILSKAKDSLKKQDVILRAKPEESPENHETPWTKPSE